MRSVRSGFTLTVLRYRKDILAKTAKITTTVNFVKPHPAVHSYTDLLFTPSFYNPLSVLVDLTAHMFTLVSPKAPSSGPEINLTLGRVQP